MTTWDEMYDHGLRAIARPSGAFAMVAMDQRESLRAMLAEHLPEPIELERRVAFKLAVFNPRVAAISACDQPWP